MLELNRYHVSKSGIITKDTLMRGAFNQLVNQLQAIKNVSHQVISYSEIKDDAHLIRVNAFGTEHRYEIERRLKQ